jgi:ATP-dependent Clp protease ATP-binding subunit ClpB
MDFNKMTQKTQEALHQAQSTALRYGHQEVDGEHLLLALLEQSEGLAVRGSGSSSVQQDGCTGRKPQI